MTAALAYGEARARAVAQHRDAALAHVEEPAQAPCVGLSLARGVWERAEADCMGGTPQTRPPPPRVLLQIFA